jgi:putative ABC transport system ATP-binding protein
MIESETIEPPAYLLEQVIRRKEKGGVVFELEVEHLRVEQGEFLAVVGPSGCGKSTLMDLLGLVLHPDHADNFQITVPGANGMMSQQVAGLSDTELARLRKTHIGYVLQSGGLLPFLSVRENIELTARLNGQLDADRITEELAGFLGITSQLDQKPQNLSGGQRQRVAIARGLAHRPSLVLADEPTASVDRPTALEIRDQFKELTRNANVSVLMVTHDEALVLPVVDRILGFDIVRKSPIYTVSRVVEVDQDVRH